MSRSSQQSFPGQYASLERIAEFVRKFSAMAGLDDFAIYTVETAVDEACSNIIEHAYQGENRGSIDCACEVDDQGLTITIHDRGRPFNTAWLAKPNLSENVMDREEHGLGWYIIQQWMDQVTFLSDPGQGNTLVLRKNKEQKA